MTEQELRALIRAAVERHLGAAPAESAPVAPAGPSRPGLMSHVSHGLYLTLPGGGDACLIESAVPCNHCGYCQSHGH